jgi:hypothetical protein
MRRVRLIRLSAMMFNFDLNSSRSGSLPVGIACSGGRLGLPLDRYIAHSAERSHGAAGELRRHPSAVRYHRVLPRACRR